MAKKRKPFLLTWREAVASKSGPPKGPTRHVLLTLSLHMDTDGASCWPSTQTLRDETGLTRKTVETHLRTAESEGWIRRLERRGDGQSWRRFEYRAKLPKGWVPPTQPSDESEAEGGVPRTQPSTPEGGVPPTQPSSPKVEYDVPNVPEVGRGVIHDRRLGISRQKVEYDVPMSSPVSSSKRSINPPASPALPVRARNGDAEATANKAGRQEDFHADSDPDLEDSEQRGLHPRIGALWGIDVRRAINETWHHGADHVHVHGERVGMGAEYHVANDLLHLTDGDLEFVRWLIVEAPALLGWSSEPRSLKWGRREQNLGQARGEFAKRSVPVTSGVDLGRLSMPGMNRERTAS